jgi:sporulation protein YlmC with PRC-barrel domain
MPNDYKFEAQVNGRDKQIGRLQKIVVDAKTKTVTHLLVTTGRLFKQTVVLPASVVETITDPREIQLSIYSDEVSNYSVYSKTVISDEPTAASPSASSAYVLSADGLPMTTPLATPEPGITTQAEIVVFGVPEGAVLLSGETAVSGAEDRIGQLSHVLVDEAFGRLVQLVVTRGNRLPQNLVIHAEKVEKLEDTLIQVAMTKAEVEQLPEYAVSQNINGSQLEAEAALAETAPLSENSELATELTDLLAADPRTETAVVDLLCDRGVVTLTGEVADQNIKETAVALIAQHPKVVTINNELKIAR